MFIAQTAAGNRPPQYGAVSIALRLIVKELGESKEPARRTARDQRHVELPIRTFPSHDHVARRLSHRGLDALVTVGRSHHSSLPFQRAELDRLTQRLDFD